ncbi:hypothetical protein KKA08_01210, partial [bacterium]|nr:hypothetical protein [bacterium]
MTLTIRFSLLGILFVLLLLFAWACEDSNNNVITSNGPVTLTWFTPPQNLEATQLATFPVIAEISGVNAYDVDSVKAVITDASGGEVAQFQLYDDANAYERFDALEFCSAYSGDVVAHDGKFTRQINGQFAPQTGDYDFTLHAWWDNSTQEADPVTVTVAESVPPLLSDLFFPISLESGFDPIQINLKAIDPDTIFGDYVTDVFMKFYAPQGVQLDSFYLSSLGGDLYGTTLTPDINIGLVTDTYIFAFWAKDAFNN